jgi:hypothetical protein
MVINIMFNSKLFAENTIGSLYQELIFLMLGFVSEMFTQIGLARVIFLLRRHSCLVLKIVPFL